MTKFVSFRWKKDFIEQDWYKKHPASSYLSKDAKIDMMEAYILGETEMDLDSEAELFIEEYNNTN
jgi:hypothetical protein